MTISTTTIKNSASGNGSTTAFTYSFKITSETEIQVIVKTNATGAESVRSIGTGSTNYGIVDNGASGGTITMVTAPASGTTLVIIKDKILNNTGRAIPTILDYTTHIAKRSMFNTPPVFAIYVSMLTLEWLKNNGGIEWIEKLNNSKAELLYKEIDRNPLFKGIVAIEDRSKMNITFTLTDNSKQKTFDKLWNDAGISGLNGHRSVGGYRASIYNALPKESIQVLINTMQELEKIS